MNTERFIEPELPVPASVCAMMLLVLANRRSVRMLDVTESPGRWANAIDYARDELGWALDVDSEGTVTASADATCARGFECYWFYLRHRVNAIENFRAVTRSMVLPRLAAMTRERAARPSPAIAPLSSKRLGAQYLN